MESGFEYTTEYGILKDKMQGLTYNGWHRIFIERQPQSLRLTNEAELYLGIPGTVYPNLNTALLINFLNLSFEKGILGGDNSHIYNKNTSPYMASRLGLSYGFYMLVAKACEGNFTNEQVILLRQDLDKVFPRLD